MVDPSGRATDWLKTHLEKEGKVEEVNPSDRRFGTTLELAVEFGKILVVTNVETVPPVLYPILRGEIITQGNSSLAFSHRSKKKRSNVKSFFFSFQAGRRGRSLSATN